MIKDQTQTLSRVRNNSMAFGKLQVCAVHTAVTMLFVSTRVIKDPCYFTFKYCFGVSPQSWLCFPFVHLPSLIFFLWNSGSCGFPVYGRRSTWQSETGNAQRLLNTGAEDRVDILLMKLVETTGVKEKGVCWKGWKMFRSVGRNGNSRTCFN